MVYEWHCSGYLTFHATDLLDKRSLRRLVKKLAPDFIFHLASFGAYAQQTDCAKMEEVNIRGTRHLLESTVDLPYRVLVHTGSSSEYGFKDHPMKESDVLAPVSYYAITKATATHLCQMAAKTFHKPIVVLRPFSVYGSYEEGERLIPTAIEAIRHKKNIRLTPGHQRRDFVYVDDVVAAYLKAIEHAAAIGGHVINIGTGTQSTNDEVVRTLFTVAGQTVEVEKGGFPARSWDTSHWVADISRAARLLGWKPAYTLERGLSKTFQWFQTHSSLYEKD
ncbi:MAG: Nucleoside-diphosphate-sugar epimerase [Microgenomates group bacterium GW2011_GWA2_47_8]|nr:MAG: Nucleoside-diphosphate-sugar epimerase [Microgenomates group bacterium GW2011_GWA2_47_8]